MEPCPWKVSIKKRIIRDLKCTLVTAVTAGQSYICGGCICSTRWMAEEGTDTGSNKAGSQTDKRGQSGTYSLRQQCKCCTVTTFTRWFFPLGFLFQYLKCFSSCPSPAITSCPFLPINKYLSRSSVLLPWLWILFVTTFVSPNMFLCIAMKVAQRQIWQKRQKEKKKHIKCYAVKRSKWQQKSTTYKDTQAFCSAAQRTTEPSHTTLSQVCVCLPT